MELHVWGNSDISIIDPESRACAWLLCLHLVPQKVPFKIVPSSNTNIADGKRLPLLLVNKDSEAKKHEGYTQISTYICEEFPTDTKFIPDGRLSDFEQLLNISLISFFGRTLHCVNQYNLYVNSRNYELYTRKLFSSYLPFPMMYNQPSKFHKAACEEVKTIGLGVGKTGLFNFSTGEGEVAETELVNDDEDYESDQVAISALHEKVLLAKEKNSSILKETRYSLRCLGLLGSYIAHLSNVFKELNPNSPVEYANLFRSKKVGSSELLLYSYFYSLTHEDLPDRFVANYLQEKYPSFWSFARTITEALNSSLSPEYFRAPSGAERPTLWNEIAYTVGYYRY